MSGRRGKPKLARKGLVRGPQAKAPDPLPEAEELRDRIQSDERVAVWVSYLLHGTGGASDLHRVSRETVRRVVREVESDPGELAKAREAYEQIRERSTSARDRLYTGAHEELLRRLPTLKGSELVELVTSLPAAPPSAGSGPVVGVPTVLTQPRPDTGGDA